MVLKNKKILLGVTGSVAACKSVDLARRLVEEGAAVNVVMTEASKNFITSLSLEIASQNRVLSDTFQDPMSHISLTRDANLMVVAPATANIIGKFANGIADDMLSTCLISFSGKTVIAPAMNWRMYENPVFRRNVDYLASIGVLQVGPEKGGLACGEKAMGRMADITRIIEGIKAALSKKDLSGKKVVVTAGPTREYMDPVRFISNRSSGKMGYAIARAACRRGAEVVLVSGPSGQIPPPDALFVPVETSEGMRQAVIGNIKGSHVLIMAAAVADFSPKVRNPFKIPKSREIALRLGQTHDILREVGSMKKRPFLVGFAAETGDKVGRARKKLFDKGADMIVFNDVTIPGAGFDVDTNEITMIEEEGATPFPLMSKEEVADVLLDRIVRLIA